MSTDTMTTVQFNEDNLSDRQRQVLNVLRSGKGDQLDDLMARLADQASAGYAQIADDDTRADSWKSEQLDRLHQSTVVSLDAELTRMAGSSTNGHRSDFGRVFGTEGVSGDAASLAISRRDAGDRVDSVQSTDDLLKLLERANVSGDEVLARAVAEKAYENRNSRVLNRFLETRPELDEPATRLWKRRLDQEQEPERLWNFAMQMAALKPPGRRGAR